MLRGANMRDKKTKSCSGKARNTKTKNNQD